MLWQLYTKWAQLVIFFVFLSLFSCKPTQKGGHFNCFKQAHTIRINFIYPSNKDSLHGDMESDKRELYKTIEADSIK